MKGFKENTEWIFWTTITITFVLLEHNGTEPLFLIAYSLIPLLVLIFYYKRSFWTIAIYLLFFGVLGRYTRYFRGVYSSDVLPTINDFIGYFIHGKNVYESLVAAHTGIIPFVYLPFTLYWYLPARILNIDFRFYEMLVSLFVPILFFLIPFIMNKTLPAGRQEWKILPILSVISLTPFLLDLSADGSNDNSAIFLLLSSIVFLAWSIKKKNGRLAFLSAVFLGFAISFKQYSFFYLLFFIPFLFKKKGFLPINFRKYFFTTFITFFLISLPFIFSSPLGFFKNIFYAEVANQVNHPIWGWNIWLALKYLFGFIPSIQLLWVVRTTAVLSTIFVIFKYFKIDKFNKVFIASGITILVYLIFSSWTTHAYFTFLIPLLALGAFELEGGKNSAG